MVEERTKQLRSQDRPGPQPAIANSEQLWTFAQKGLSFIVGRCPDELDAGFARLAARQLTSTSSRAPANRASSGSAPPAAWKARQHRQDGELPSPSLA